MGDWIRRFGADEQGATSIEYALIASVMVVAIAGGASLFSDEVYAMFNFVSDNVELVTPS